MLAGTGRRLRCARCAFEWQAVMPVVAPQQPVPAAIAAPDNVPEDDEHFGSPAPARRATAAITAWTVSLVVLCSIGWGRCSLAQRHHADLAPPASAPTRRLG